MQAVLTAFGSVARGAAKALDKVGAALEVSPYIEHLAPSTKILAYAGKSPAIHETAFIAPSASVIGSVAIGKGSSVWYGAVLRGDVNKISIGEQTAVGDRVVVHVAKFAADLPTKIGNRVTIGPRAIIHAATLEDESQVGAGAQVLDKAVVQTHAIVAPGAVVTPGKVVKTGQLWAGVPAAFVRELTAEEILKLKDAAADAFELSAVHKAETSKDYKQVIVDEEEWLDSQQRSKDYFPRVKDTTDPAELLPGMGVPGRIFNHPLTVPLPEDDNPRPRP